MAECCIEACTLLFPLRDSKGSQYLALSGHVMLGDLGCQIHVF